MPLTRRAHSQRAGLHHEVIAEILPWLPVKSLVRFRCVSKNWNSLISDSNFVELHLNRSPRNASLMLTLEDKKDLDEELEDELRVMSCSISSLIQNPSSIISDHDRQYPLSYRYLVLGSCNGLVCLRGSEGNRKKYWVRFWNPALRIKSKKSPRLFLNLLWGGQVGCTFGFGYEKSSNTYKVVAVIGFNQSKMTQVKVYAMGDHCWRDIERFPAFPVTFEKEGKFVSGTLNWLATRRKFTYYHGWGDAASHQLTIVSLDLKNETYKQLPLPAGVSKLPHFKQAIGVLGDCVCLFHDYENHFVVWQMKEFGVEKSWTQFAKFSYHHFPFAIARLNPVCILEDGDVLLLRNYDSELILYNRRDDTVEHIEIDNVSLIGAKDYFQSLILPSWD